MVIIFGYIPTETSSSGTYYAYILINSKSVIEQELDEKFVSRILPLSSADSRSYLIPYIII